MGAAKLLTAAGGGITLDAASTATDKTITIPAVTGVAMTAASNANNAQFNTITGTAPLYSARAWVNFNGTGTVAIRSSGNVSSITDSGTGLYGINFTTAMPDANYCTALSNGDSVNFDISNRSGSSASVVNVALFKYDATGFADSPYVNVAIFR
jgi:hypothetical protein